jgi:hypothetical protein
MPSECLSPAASVRHCAIVSGMPRVLPLIRHSDRMQGGCNGWPTPRCIGAIPWLVVYWCGLRLHRYALRYARA